MAWRVGCRPRRWSGCAPVRPISSGTRLRLAAVAVHHFSRLIAVAGIGLGLGAFLFGGSLYLYAWTGQSGFALVTPVGGALMIGGWFAVLAAAFRVGARS